MKAFFAALNFIPGWAWGGVCAGLIATHIFFGAQLKTERLAHQTTKTQYAQAVADAERASREAEARNRQTEQELRHAQDAHAQEVAALHLDVDRHRAAAAVVARRVHDAAQGAAARARAQCAAAPAGGLGASTGDPIGVLADVLARADARAGSLATALDESRVAGNACVRFYEQVRETVNRD